MFVFPLTKVKAMNWEKKNCFLPYFAAGHLATDVSVLPWASFEVKQLVRV